MDSLKQVQVEPLGDTLALVLAKAVIKKLSNSLAVERLENVAGRNSSGQA